MDSVRTRRVLAGTYPPPSFRCHKLLVMIVLVWLLQCCQAQNVSGMLPTYNRVLARRGQQTSLLCIVYITRFPFYLTWYNNRDLRINDAPWIHLSERIDGSIGFFWLTIGYVHSIHFGKYRCEADFKYNRYNGFYTLVEDKDPVPRWS